MRPVFRQGVVGALEFHPPEGPPTSGSVTLRSPDGSVFRTAVVADAPSVSTTLTALATRGAVKVLVESLSSIAPGLELWAGDAADARDNFVVEEADPDELGVLFRRPLEFIQKQGSALKSGELSVDLEADEVAEEMENAIAIWTYVVDGTTYYSDQLWDVVARRFRLMLTRSRLQRYVASQLLKQTEQTLSELTAQAEWLISQQLRYYGVDPKWVIDMGEFERVSGLTIRLILLCEEVQFAIQRLGVLTQSKKDLNDEWKMLMRNRLRWLDKNADLTVSEDELAVRVEHPIVYPDFSGMALP